MISSQATCSSTAGKINRIPIVMMRSKFWEPFLKWMTTTFNNEGMISKDDIKYIQVVDTPEEALKIIRRAHAKGMTGTVKPW